MSQAISAPPWDKPKPNLAHMPTEIFEKIIGFTVPDTVEVYSKYHVKGCEQYRRHEFFL
ncbi:uncharacterized protein AB675_11773 [Cyphellophora attinorum]|uniref:Uncharacterized protein n=1 Tax=Cyphellophora attinorum TaxID=1664694 RepID=A0A0N1HJR2_9EURO|nr:uncharacterized protein AB675_11773 [Phialophora attinorum]KPI36785.1 hypothetical protein AB675_11773 [Phialophora attinorum]